MPLVVVPKLAGQLCEFLGSCCPNALMFPPCRALMGKKTDLNVAGLSIHVYCTIAAMAENMMTRRGDDE